MRSEARQHANARLASKVIACVLTATLVLLSASAGTQTAAANGDTRSLTFFHTHTQESATITFRRDGRYDDRGLEQLNWLLRDWRVEQNTRMDPRLFDILWEVYKEAGASGPIHVVSAYRSPQTNGMLRARSSGVSEHSQHMLGKAMDVRFPGVETGRLRAIAMRMQYGGVGYYASSDFVHIDTGSVRAWPRMSQDQLVRLFPDGKTLHLPASGKPLAGYELAKAEIPARNAALADQSARGGGGSLLAALFGRRTPEPAAPPAEKTVEKPVIEAQVASADPETVMSFAPLPPRRPKIDPAAVQLAAATPAIAVVPAPREADRREIVAALGRDTRTERRVLFDANSTAFVNLGFSEGPSYDLNVNRFTGPAVKVVKRIQQASAGF